MTAQQAEKLGYLGLGMMGFPMARRLINAGHDVSVWNRSTGKAASLVEAGAKLKAHPREVADSAAVLFMCVTDAAAVEEVVFGGDGLAAVSGAGKLVVDFSSIHPDAARDIAARLRAANGMGWVDAPVSGGTKGAEEGTLAVMAGGDVADIERVRPYVLAMARRLTHMGPIGAGQRDSLFDRFQQPLANLRLGHIVGRAAVERLDGQVFAAVAGHQNDGHARMMHPHGGDQLQAIAVGHLQIPFRCNYSCRAWCKAFIRRRSDASRRCSRIWTPWPTLHAAPRARFRWRRWQDNCSG